MLTRDELARLRNKLRLGEPLTTEEVELLLDEIDELEMALKWSKVTG